MPAANATTMFIILNGIHLISVFVTFFMLIAFHHVFTSREQLHKAALFGHAERVQHSFALAWTYFFISLGLGIITTIFFFQIS